MINKKLLEEALEFKQETKVVKKPASAVKVEHKQFIEEDMGSLFVPALLVFYGATLLKMAGDYYQKNLTKFARQCSGLPDAEKSICIVRAKRRALVGQKSFLQKALSKCKDAKDPSVCDQKLKSKIRSNEEEISYLADRLKRYGVSDKVM
jgi:hypothetical protein